MMPGNGSSLDKNDYQLLERMLLVMERQAEAQERIAEALEE